MAVNDVYRCNIHYQVGSQPTMNVVHLREMVANTDAVPARAVVAVIENIWGAEYISTLFSDQANVIILSAQRIFPTASVPATLVLGTVANPLITGGAISGLVPPQAAALISLYTAVPLAVARGRIYLPGIAEIAQADGQLVAAAIGNLESFADNFEVQHTPPAPFTGEYRFVVWSRVPPGSGNNVTVSVPHTNLATQRGRRAHPGIGV